MALVDLLSEAQSYRKGQVYVFSEAMLWQDMEKYLKEWRSFQYHRAQEENIKPSNMHGGDFMNTTLLILFPKTSDSARPEPPNISQ